MMNIPKVKAGIVAVSRDCFPESLSVNRRKALVEAYRKKYDGEDIYECPVCIVEMCIRDRFTAVSGGFSVSSGLFGLLRWENPLYLFLAGICLAVCGMGIQWKITSHA